MFKKALLHLSARELSRMEVSLSSSTDAVQQVTCSISSLPCFQLRADFHKQSVMFPTMGRVPWAVGPVSNYGQSAINHPPCCQLRAEVHEQSALFPTTGWVPWAVCPVSNYGQLGLKHSISLSFSAIISIDWFCKFIN